VIDVCQASSNCSCRDMFQSSLGKPSEMHAVSRALSGGPVYVSDRPYTQAKDILRKIAFPSGKNRPCALPNLHE
jgi:hypothetical protein